MKITSPIKKPLPSWFIGLIYIIMIVFPICASEAYKRLVPKLEAISHSPGWSKTLGSLIIITVLLFVTAGLSDFLLKFSDIDRLFQRQRFGHFWLGVFITLVSAGVVYILTTIAGWFVIISNAFQEMSLVTWVVTLYAAFFGHLLTAVLEEIMFRFYLLNGVKYLSGNRECFALIVSSCLFAVIHIPQNMGKVFDWDLFVPFYLLGSFVFGWSYLKTRSLWVPIGIHMAWNFIYFGVFHTLDNPTNTIVGVRALPVGPRLLVGSISPDIRVGLVDMIIFVAISIAVLLIFKNSKESKRGDALSHIAPISD